MKLLHRLLVAIWAVSAALLGASAAAPALAQKRVALVVGNNTYQNLGTDKHLKNAVGDARIVRDTLRKLDFEVLYGENLDRRTLVDRLFDLAARIGRDDTAFFFFAGHGVSFSGANYLLPSDIPTPRATGRAEEGRLAEQAIAESVVIERMTAAGARVTIIVLDACRDNPLQGTDRRSVGTTRGLAPSQSARGVFSIYSAGFGQAALDRLGPDDRHPNSVFTRVFVEKLKTPGLDLKAVATQTRAAVVEMTERIGHDQFPAYYDQVVGGDVFLAGLPASATPTAPTPPRPPTVDRCAAAAEHWRSAEAIGSRAAFEDHLARFPDCAFAGLARAGIASLPAATAAPPTVPPAAPPASAVYDYNFVGSRNDCEWLCSRDGRCQSHRYDAASKKCELSGRPDIRVPSTPATVLRPPNGATAPPSSAAAPSSGATAPLSTHTSVGNSADCEFVCRQNRCRGYSFDPATKKCVYESGK